MNRWESCPVGISITADLGDRCIWPKPETHRPRPMYSHDGPEQWEWEQADAWNREYGVKLTYAEWQDASKVLRAFLELKQ